MLVLLARHIAVLVQFPLRRKGFSALGAHQPIAIGHGRAPLAAAAQRGPLALLKLLRLSFALTEDRPALVRASSDVRHTEEVGSADVRRLHRIGPQFHSHKAASKGLNKHHGVASCHRVYCTTVQRDGSKAIDHFDSIGMQLVGVVFKLDLQRVSGWYIQHGNDACKRAGLYFHEVFKPT